MEKPLRILGKPHYGVQLSHYADSGVLFSWRAFEKHMKPLLVPIASIFIMVASILMWLKVCGQ